MRIPGLGWEIRRAPQLRQKHSGLQTISSSGRGSGWWPLIREPSTGAWQRNQEISVDTAITNPTVWACVTRIANDISKVWIDLLERDDDGINAVAENSAFSPVIRQPNRHSTRIKFFQYWMMSKLLHGNTFILKSRDQRGVVDGLYILDPTRVQLLIAPDGSLFYQIGPDNTASLDTGVVVPEREIIHDLAEPVYHPYLGVSPLHAAMAAALQGLNIQKTSAKLSASGFQPSGILSSPHNISSADQEALVKYYEANFMGQDNTGKLLMVSGGLDFKPMAMTAADNQLIEQLKWGDERIAGCYGMPLYMIGLGPPPPYTDIQSINLQYYTQALQNPIENIEELLRLGLELPRRLSVEFDLDSLARMDTRTQVDNSTKGILGGLFMPNEERAKFDRVPVPGGDTVYLQQQQYSLEALSRRDEAAPAPPTTPVAGPPASPTKADTKLHLKLAYSRRKQGHRVA